MTEVHAGMHEDRGCVSIGFKTGIRIGSAKDGRVTAFIPTPSAEIATPEGVGFDDAGNVYGSWTGKMAVRRWTKN